MESFAFDNILLDKNRFKNTFVYGISYKALIIPKPWSIRFDKRDGFLEFLMEVDI